jgi:formate dehydrogenase
MAKIISVLYDDPVDGYPKSYPRDDLPKIEHYPGGQTLPTPKAIDFQPGALLGSVSGVVRHGFETPGCACSGGQG